jgi:hypothetical protein
MTLVSRADANDGRRAVVDLVEGSQGDRAAKVGEEQGVGLGKLLVLALGHIARTH